MEIEKVSLDISLTRKDDFINLFQKGYLENLHKDFIKNKEEKKHNINSHSNWFNKKIKLNHIIEPKDILNKWKICKIDYGMNIGTEINGIRPSIVFKNSNYKYGEDIIVIPITSFKEGEIKSIDEFDVEIIKSEKNGLKNNSLLKIRQLRSVSKKRLKRDRSLNLTS